MRLNGLVMIRISEMYAWILSCARRARRACEGLPWVWCAATGCCAAACRHEALLGVLKEGGLVQHVEHSVVLDILGICGGLKGRGVCERQAKVVLL